ncbi:MAG: hypothetical protein KGM24_09720 [Elusimicrobia bacterium]|nr:hypothetical protein [Elusimicrobiota bacterium]
MRPLLFLLALPFAGPVAAQVAVVAPAAPKAAPPPAAAQAAAPKETCPCSDYRFAPKTDKARAVAAYWKAREKYKVAMDVGAFALIAAELAGRPTSTLRDAQDEIGRDESDMLAARDRAAKLGGLTVAGGGEDARVTITLVRGVDYSLDGR